MFIFCIAEFLHILCLQKRKQQINVRIKHLMMTTVYLELLLFFLDAITEYFKLIFEGLALSPTVISATLLAMTRIMYEFKGKAFFFCLFSLASSLQFKSLTKPLVIF